MFLFLIRAFETQMTRLEAEFVQREAPPSYGQLIAQGLIPPVDDFPVYNPTQVCEYDIAILYTTSIQIQFKFEFKWTKIKRNLKEI